MKPARIQDVADRAEVTVLTARRALKGAQSVRPYIRQRIEDAARALNYKPNLLARAMATRSSSFVTVTLHGLHNPLYGQLADSILRRLRAAEFHPVFFDNVDAVVDFNDAFFAAGSILLYCGAERVNAIARRHAVVTFGASEFEIQSASDVTLDLAPAYTELTRTALARGRRRIGLFADPAMPGYDSKFQPIKRALSAAGLNIVPEASQLYDPANSLASCGRLAELIAGNPTLLDTVFCGWDMDAARLRVELHRRGIAPVDVQVVGCDGTIPLPGVWTVTIDVDEIALWLCSFLQRHLNGNKKKEQFVLIPKASITDEP